jgi:hypothetical protein
LRYVQAQLMQMAQTAGCNARHQVEQRLSRWLLLCADRLESDSINLTHEFLPHMLGTGPSHGYACPGVAAQEELDRVQPRKNSHHRSRRIGSRSCECYRIVKSHPENYHEVETGFGRLMLIWCLRSEQVLAPTFFNIALRVPG